jgi:hypothetical protein
MPGSNLAEDIVDELLSRLTQQPLVVDLLSATKTDVAQAVRNNLMSTTIPVNVKQVNDAYIKGTGQPGNEWGPL